MIDLRDRQYDEVCSTMDALQPKDGQPATAAALQNQLDSKKTLLELESEKQAQELEREQTLFEQQQKAELDDELSRFEQDLAEKRKWEEQKTAEKLAVLKQKKAALAESKKLQDAAAKVAAETLEKNEHEQIMTEHENSLKRSAEQHKSEKVRQKAATLQKLREKRLNAKTRRLKMLKEAEAAKEQPVTQPASSVGDGESELQVFGNLPSIDDNLEMNSPATARKSFGSQAEEPLAGFDLEAEDIGKLEQTRDGDGVPPAAHARGQAASSPLATASMKPTKLFYENVSPYNSSGSSSDESLGVGKGSTYDKSLIERLADVEAAIKGVGSADFEVDVEVADPSWCLEGAAPTIVRPESITAGRYAAYRFGLFVMDLLEAKLGFPKPPVLLASTLPRVSSSLGNNYHHNTYRRSVYYERASKALFVRVERLDSPGGFAVMLVHTLAHLKAGDMVDDTSEGFLRQYYAALKCYCADVCACQSLLPISATDADKAGSLLQRALCEHGFEQMQDARERAGLVHVLLRFGAIDASIATRVQATVAALQVSRRTRASPVTSGDGDGDGDTLNADVASQVHVELGKVAFATDTVAFPAQDEDSTGSLTVTAADAASSGQSNEDTATDADDETADRIPTATAVNTTTTATSHAGSKLQEERDVRMSRRTGEAATRSADRKKLRVGQRVSILDLDLELDLVNEDSTDGTHAEAKHAHTVEELKRMIAGEPVAAAQSATDTSTKAGVVQEGAARSSGLFKSVAHAHQKSRRRISEDFIESVHIATGIQANVNQRDKERNEAEIAMQDFARDLLQSRGKEPAGN